LTIVGKAPSKALRGGLGIKQWGLKLIDTIINNRVTECEGDCGYWGVNVSEEELKTGSTMNWTTLPWKRRR